MTSSYTALSLGSGGKVPKKYEELAKKYELTYRSNGVVRIKDIKPEDVELLVEDYATNLKCDIYTLCNVLHVTRQTVYNMMHSEKYADLYASAKSQRAAIAYRRGFDVLEETYAEAKAGDASREAVNAARHLANYCGSYAQNLVSELQGDDKAGGLSIQINLPQFSNLANPIIDVTAQDDNDKDKEH